MAGWLQEQFTAGRTVRAIANEVGCAPATVRETANLLGVQRRRSRQHPALRDTQWLQRVYVEEGRSLSSIANEIGASSSTVSQALARAGIC